MSWAKLLHFAEGCQKEVRKSPIEKVVYLDILVWPDRLQQYNTNINGCYQSLCIEILILT